MSKSSQMNQGRNRAPDSLRNIRLLVGGNILALAALALLPFWQDVRLSGIRAEIDEVFVPARNNHYDLKLSMLHEMSHLRSFLVTQDRGFLDRLAWQIAATSDKFEDLERQVHAMTPEVRRTVQLVESNRNDWLVRVEDLIYGGLTRDEYIDILANQNDKFDNSFVAHARLDLAFDTHLSTLRQDARRAHGVAKILSTILFVVALAAAVAALALGRRLQKSNRILDRQARDLVRMNENLENTVEARTRQVTELANALTFAEQAERDRISRLLHDHVQQLLYALRIKIPLLRDISAAQRKRELGEIAEIVSRAIRSTRSLAMELSPPILEGEGLDEALEWLVKDLLDNHQLRAHLSIRSDTHDLPSEKVMLLFHTVRELLFNVVKHAGTAEAWIEVTSEENCIRISVTDEGRGFVPEQAVEEDGSPGLGLFRVRERLRLAGGEIQIVSKPGRGTTATVSLPVGWPVVA